MTETSIIDRLGELAAKAHLRRRSIAAIENAAELALTNLSVKEVRDVLKNLYDYLEEFEK